MILTAEHPVTNLYLVEVSGWDEDKAFFVENSELEWTEESGKQVTLNRGLTENAVIFHILVFKALACLGRPD